MTRIITMLLLFVVVGVTGAEIEKDAVAYATYAPKPDYPAFLRMRRVEGSGLFRLHVRADGAVQSVDAVRSTGSAALDQCAITAFMKWRFRAGHPMVVKMPITFSVHDASY